MITLYSKILLFQDEYIKVISLRPNPKTLLNNPNITSFQKEKLEYLISISNSFIQPKLSIFENDRYNQCYSNTCDLIITQNALPNICGNINSIPLSYSFLPDILNELMMKGFTINNNVAKISKYLGFYSTQGNMNNSNNETLICTMLF